MCQPLQQGILKMTLPGPESIILVARREANLSFSLEITLPVVVEEAGGISVDVEGNHLVDLAAGIAVTSRIHPKVVAAAQA